MPFLTCANKANGLTNKAKINIESENTIVPFMIHTKGQNTRHNLKISDTAPLANFYKNQPKKYIENITQNEKQITQKQLKVLTLFSILNLIRVIKKLLNNS